MLLSGGEAMGAKQPSAPKAPEQTAARIVAVKANAKLSADQRGSRAGQQYPVANGCFYMREQVTLALFVLDLQKVAGGPAEEARQLQTLGGWGVLAFSLLAPVGILPMA